MPLKIHCYFIFYKINMLRIKQLFMRKCFVILSSERSQAYTFDHFTQSM